MASFAELKSSALRLATNCRGWRTQRRLLVIESDDWGAIRMPSRQAWQALLSAGIRVDRSRYDSLDCLENRADLEALLDVIGRHRDLHGSPATFTFNTVMGNPDFDAIKEHDFQSYHRESLFESYRKYHAEELEPIWDAAQEEKLIRPQLHAREHLNSTLWMKDLQAGLAETRKAFAHRFYGLKTKTSSEHQKNYLAACWAESPEDVRQMGEALSEAADAFQAAFGFRSSTFIPCNYVLPEELEPKLAKIGIGLLQCQRGRIQPVPDRGGRASIRRHFTGQKNAIGQFFSVRNVMFEPYLDERADWVRKALNEIREAFQLNRPAIISTHRINYVSGMCGKHRDRCLILLDELLRTVSNRWPDVEFITSDTLMELMRSDDRH